MSMLADYVRDAIGYWCKKNTLLVSGARASFFVK